MVVVAQLAERLVVVQEVAGSTPSITPMERVVMVIRNGPFAYPQSGSPAHGVPDKFPFNTSKG